MEFPLHYLPVTTFPANPRNHLKFFLNFSPNPILLKLAAEVLQILQQWQQRRRSWIWQYACWPRYSSSAQKVAFGFLDMRGHCCPSPCCYRGDPAATHAMRCRVLRQCSDPRMMVAGCDGMSLYDIICLFFWNSVVVRSKFCKHCQSSSNDFVSRSFFRPHLGSWASPDMQSFAIVLRMMGVWCCFRLRALFSRSPCIFFT